MIRPLYSKTFFIILLLICLIPGVTAPIALLLGVAFAFILGNPFITKTRSWTHTLLQVSVVGLGFGINALTALQAGKTGFVYTICGIAGTFIIGLFIARSFKINKKISFLISTGTAICGGSAIAAVAPVINSKSEDTSVALGTVFILNSVALITFPVVGHWFHLTQEQFGLWAAIAIHDTSSVVGASSVYGSKALAIATTVKLTRALWIIPVTLVSAFLFKSDVKKVTIPWFILFFFIAMLVNSYFTFIHPVSSFIFILSRQGLVVTLFLIGTNISRETLKNVGIKPFLLGILLWIIVSIVTLIAI